MAFGITEPDAGSNSHRITTTARRDGDDWVLTGRKVYISGVDQRRRRADRRAHGGRPDRQAQARAVRRARPTPPGFEYRADRHGRSSMPEKQFLLFLDDVRLPAEALVGDEDAGLRAAVRRAQPGADHGRGRSRSASARYALEQGRRPTRTSGRCGASRSARTRASRTRWPRRKIELELARLMMQKAASLYDAGDDMGAGEAANMAKYAAAEAAVRAVDQAVQTHGGNGLATEYGLGDAARRRPGRPDRAGEPRDDPQLRRPVQPRPAEVVLTEPR